MNFRIAELVAGFICLFIATFLFYQEYHQNLVEDTITEEPLLSEKPALDDAGEEIVALVDETEPEELAPKAAKKEITFAIPTLSQHKHKVQFGDTLYSFLLRHIQSIDDVQEIIRLLRKAKLFNTLRAGYEFIFIFEQKSSQARPTFSKMICFIQTKKICIEKSKDGQISLAKTALEHAKKYVAGSIDHSLYVDAKKLGAPVSTTNQFVKLISHNVDFQRSIKSGDRFEILMEVYSDGETKKEIYGDILFGALHLKGDSQTIYRYQTADGTKQYYSGSGKGTVKALLKTPVPGARLSGTYGQRKHPVLGYSMMHRGIDFAAPRGTPILAAGDGVVQRANRYGSFGNYLRIKHNKEYATAYAHVSKYAKGIRAGKKVTQGQVVAYVGATGRATGPHLHYEVLRNGKQINPQSLKLPSQQVLTGKLLVEFKKQKAEIDANIASLKEESENGGG